MEQRSWAVEGYSLNREDLERLTKIGAVGTEKATELSTTITDGLVAAREGARKASHDAALGYRARQTARTVSVTPVNLASPMKNREPVVRPKLENPGGSRKVNREKFTKIIIGAGVAILVLAGATALNITTHNNFEKAMEVVSEIDAGDYTPMLNGFVLEERANGSYMFRDKDGDGFIKVNGIDANDFGKSMEKMNSEENSGPTL